MVVLKIGHKITKFQRHKAHYLHFFSENHPFTHIFKEY